MRAGAATKPMRTSDADFGLLTYPLTRPRYLTPVSSTIGYWANKIHNVLFVTGDPPKMSPTYPRSTADSTSTRWPWSALRRLTSTPASSSVATPCAPHKDPRTRFTIGSGCEPEALDGEREFARQERNIDAGADYIVTQPAFNLEALKNVQEYRAKLPIVVGVMVLRDLQHARRITQVPGVTVPEAVFTRLHQYESEADQAQAGIEPAAEQARCIRREGWAGLYLMSPSSHQPVLEVLKQGLG